MENIYLFIKKIYEFWKSHYINNISENNAPAAPLLKKGKFCVKKKKKKVCELVGNNDYFTSFINI